MMSVLYTESLSGKTWLLTARLCSNLKGSRTTPSRTGNVRRRSSLGLPAQREVRSPRSLVAPQGGRFG